MKNIISKNDDILNNSEYIKLILMIFVIIGHSIDFWSGNWFTQNPAIQSSALNIGQMWINSFHIYSFTLISGFIFAYLMQNNYYKSFKIFVAKKCQRLLVPYCFVSLFWVIPLSLYFLNYSFKTICWKYVLCNDPSQLWFLWMLFWCFLFAWILYRPISSNSMFAFVVSISAYIIGFMLSKLSINLFCISTGLMYFTFFVLGMKLKTDIKFANKLYSVPVFLWLFLDIAVFVFFVIVDGNSGILFRIVSLFARFSLNIIGAFTAVIVLDLLVQKFTLYNKRYFVSLTRYMMPIYLLHQQIIYFVIDELNGKVSPLINAVLNFSISFTVSLAISVFLMKFKPIRWLMGSK